MKKLQAVLNFLPHWVFVMLSMFAGAFVQSLQGNSNLFAELLSGDKTALWADTKTALFVGIAAILGYLKTDPWATAQQKRSAAAKATTLPPGSVAAFLVLFGGALGGLSLISAGISGCKPAVSAIVTGVDTACTQLESQPEPAWVYFTCAVLDDAGNIINTFTAKVPATQAKAFALKNSSARAVKKDGAQ